MKELIKEAQALQKTLLRHRRTLHACAETGFDLKRTTNYIRAQIEAIGCEAKDCGRAGLVVTLGGAEKRSEADAALKMGAFLLRADMDALPIAERSDEPFACDNGCMHACGHDMHAAMLLGAALLLKRRERDLPCAVKLAFQPAEERLEGAKDMIKSGLLRSPKVIGAVMLHVTTGVELPTGTLVVHKGGVSAPAADYFQITIKGKGCHGSTPHEGIDALNVAAHVLLALQQIPSKELSLSQPAVVTVGRLTGGETGNAIADSAVLEGTVRAYDEPTREKIKKRIAEIVKRISAAFNASAKTEFPTGCPTFINNPELSARLVAGLKETFGKERVLQTNAVGGGSEDFAYVSHETPTTLIALSAGEKSKGYAYPLHHPKARFDEDALWVGCAAYASAVFSQAIKND